MMQLPFVTLNIPRETATEISEIVKRLRNLETEGEYEGDLSADLSTLESSLVTTLL